jgi:hypothetical protein
MRANSILHVLFELFKLYVLTLRPNFCMRNAAIFNIPVHRSFIIHKAFTVHNSNYHSELQWERTYFYHEIMKKEHIKLCKSGRKIKYKSAGLLFPQVQHNVNCRGSPVYYNQTRHAEFLKSLWKEILLLIRETVILITH